MLQLDPLEAFVNGGFTETQISLAHTMHEGADFHGHACKFGDLEA